MALVCIHPKIFLYRESTWQYHETRMNTLEKLHQLESCLLFQRLEKSDLEHVAQKTVDVSLQAGDSLFEQMDPAKRFYLLLSGQMKLFRIGKDGNEKVVEIIHPNGTFAEALMFLENSVYPVCAEAMTESELLSIDSTDFVKVLRKTPDTLLLIAADLSKRLHSVVGELNDLSLASSTCRVANFFIQQLGDEETCFEINLPKQVLASRLSIQPETLSRIFRRMANAGLLQMEGNRVNVLDLRQLQELADTYDTEG